LERSEKDPGMNTRPPSFFIAGIIQGSSTSRELSDQSYRQRLIRLLKKVFPDASIVSPYDLHPDSIDYDLQKGKTTFFDMVNRATQCDVLIAYLPEASLGTAIEIWESHRNGVIVWTISPMKENWVIRFFSHRIFHTMAEFEKFVLGEAQEEVLRALRCRSQGSEKLPDQSGRKLRR
jgi:hypothetical protein